MEDRISCTISEWVCYLDSIVTQISVEDENTAEPQFRNEMEAWVAQLKVTEQLEEVRVTSIFAVTPSFCERARERVCAFKHFVYGSTFFDTTRWLRLRNLEITYVSLVGKQR